MRTFVILLLLANLGYLAWWQPWAAGAAAPAGSEPPFAPAPQALILLDELPQERLKLMSSLAEARSARTGAQRQLQQVQQQALTLADEIGEVQAELAQDQARSSEVQQELLNTIEAAVTAETAEIAELMANAESPADVLPAEPLAPELLPPEAQPTELLPWCASAGPFADPGTAVTFASRVEDLGGEVRLLTREEPISSTWWVHMPAFASEALAIEKLAELQARNIDSYYMRSGDMAGGISLGVYSRQESALIAQQQLANQGYASSLREVFRMAARPYVGLRLPDGSLRESPEWAAFLASAGPVEPTENACETIASEFEFP